MKRLIFTLLLTLAAASAAFGQQDDPQARLAVKERLRAFLAAKGPAINVAFKQAEKQEFNFVGVLRTGLVNADAFEIVISVTPKYTIGFRIFPQYKGKYINVDKVKNSPALMRLLLRLSDRAFLFWGADEAGDVFTGYTFTLESGFPEEAVEIVLNSIKNSDKFVGEMRPYIDGSMDASVK